MNYSAQLERIAAEELIVGSEIIASNVENPQRIIVFWPDKKTPIHAYRYCYLEREELGRQYYTIKRCPHVVLQSLCEERCRIVSRWIEEMLSGVILLGLSQKICAVFNWIDENNRNRDLRNSESAKRLYNDFTNYLLRSIDTQGRRSATDKRTTKYSYSHAASLQRAMRFILQYALDQPVETIVSWTTRIPKSQPETESHLDRFQSVKYFELPVNSGLEDSSDFKTEETLVRYGPYQNIKAYQYCYLERTTLLKGPSRRNQKLLGLVVPSTLCQKRRAIVAKWIKDMISGEVTYGFAIHITWIFDWIDKARRGNDLFSRKTAKALYSNITDDLLQNDSLSNSYRRSLQRALRYIIRSGINEPDETIEQWSSQIPTQTSYDHIIGTSHFNEVNTVSIRADSLDKAPDEIKPEVTKIWFATNELTIHAYQYCYLDRANLISDIPKQSRFSRRVNKESQCPNRCLLVRRWIKNMITGTWGYGRSSDFQKALQWVDQSQRSIEIHDPVSAKRLFKDFTDQLLHQVRLPLTGSPKGISTAYAAALQSALVDVICLATNSHESLVRTWAVWISRDYSKLPQPRLNDREAQLAYELHRRFFWAYSHAVINRETVPIKVRLCDLGFQDFVAFSANRTSYNEYNPENGISSWSKFAFSEDGFDADWLSVRRKAQASGLTITGKNYHRAYAARLEKNAYCLTRSNLEIFANRAVKHFGHMLMYASGCNASHLRGLDLTKTNLPKAGGPNRIVAYKSRPTNERQELSVSSHFQKPWRQMLRLRDWMSTFHQQTLPDYGLHIIVTRSKSEKSFSQLDAISVCRALIWPDNAPSLQTRTPRKIKIQAGLEDTNGDINLIAAAVSNKPSTIHKHYGFKKFEESAKQLSRFFDNMHRSANLRISGVPKAPIIEKGKRIPAGNCTATSEAEISFIEGIDESRAPELNCGSPLACLF